MSYLLLFFVLIICSGAIFFLNKHDVLGGLYNEEKFYFMTLMLVAIGFFILKVTSKSMN